MPDINHPNPTLVRVRDAIALSIRANMTNVRDDEIMLAANNAAQSVADIAEFVELGVNWAAMDAMADQCADRVNELAHSSPPELVRTGPNVLVVVRTDDAERAADALAAAVDRETRAQAAMMRAAKEMARGA